MILLIKASKKIQHSFMIKIFSTLDITEKYVNITKAIYEKAQPTLSFKGKKLSVSSIDGKIQGLTHNFAMVIK